MSDAPSPEPNERDDRHQRALDILLDVGTTIAQELKVATKDTPLPARAAAFDRIAEAVRRTIILSRHIAEAIPARAQRDTKRALARRRIIRTVEDTIERRAPPADVQSLRVELLERIDAREFLDDLDHRDPGELIAELCRDLGLAALSSPRRTPDDIAILCAQAAAHPGSGLPQWLAAVAPKAAQNDANNGARNDGSPGIRLKEH